MSTTWIEERENAVPRVLFVAWGKVVAGVFLADDGKLYFATSRPVSSLLHDILLSTPFLDPSQKRFLVFSSGGKKRKAVGYALSVGEQGVWVFAELARMLMWAVFDQKVTVRPVGEKVAPKTEVPVEPAPPAKEEIYELEVERVEEEEEGEKQ